MKKTFTLLLLATLLCTALPGSAQTPSPITLKGRTLTAKGTPVDYASVLLISTADTTRTYGEVTSDRGTFTMKVPKGDYRMKISYMGYDNLERALRLSGDTDLGELTLTSSTVTLDEVVVTGNIITREADRFVVNLANTPLAIGRDGKEALALAPGVWISEKGEVSVNGRGGTQIMVNERLLRETGDELLNFLRNLKAEDILKIEVIPYAGAEYDGKITGGVIKITLKKQRNDGMEGSMTMRYASSVVNNMSWYIQPAVNLKYKNKKLSLYTDLSLNRYKEGSEQSSTSLFNTTGTTTTGTTQNASGTSYNLGSYKKLQLGGVYDINDKQSIGLELNVSGGPASGNQYSNTLMNAGGNETFVDSHFANGFQATRYTVSGNYILKLDTLGSLFKLLLDYNHRSGEIHTDYHSIYTGFQQLDSIYRYGNPDQSSVYSVAGDFDIALSKKSKLMTGFKYTNTGMENTALYEYLRNDQWNRIDGLSSQNKYSENIGALYVKFSTRFKNNISLAVGLRGEYTYASPFTSNVEITDKQNYFSWLPNANLSIPLNKKQSQMIIAGYNRRIMRPGFGALNPTRIPQSEFSYYEGNPRLKAAYSNDYNLTYVLKHKYSLTFGVQNIKGMANSIATIDPDQNNVIIYKMDNIQNFTYWYASINIPTQITKWWQMNLNLNGSNMRSTMPNQPITIQNSFQGNMDNTFTLCKKWFLGASGNYSSPMAVANMRMDGRYRIDASIKRTFLDKRLTASVYIYDIFNSGRMSYSSSDPAFFSQTWQQFSFRRVGAVLRYNFKAGKAIKVKNVESGAREEGSRLGSDSKQQ